MWPPTANSRPSGKKACPQQNRLKPGFASVVTVPVAGSQRRGVVLGTELGTEFPASRVSPASRRDQYMTLPFGNTWTWIATLLRLIGGDHWPMTAGWPTASAGPRARMASTSSLRLNISAGDGLRERRWRTLIALLSRDPGTANPEEP